MHRITQRFGFRTFEVRDGDGLYLNGSKLILKGVNRHSFWPDSGRCLSEAVHRLDIATIKDMNANAVRMSHYPPDAEFLDLCDELGLYVHVPRVLSISANACLGSGVQPANVLNEIPGRTYIRRFKKTTDLVRPGPSETFAVLDENGDSIDDTLFITRGGAMSANAFLANVPGSYHYGNKGCNFSFADGHSEIHKWKDKRTMIKVNYTIQRNINCPGSPDYEWINDHLPYQ